MATKRSGIKGRSRSIRFKVWQGEHKREGFFSHPQFYAHMIAGNNEITWVTEGHDNMADVHKLCESTWKAIGKAFLAFGEDVDAPVPYTRDSLFPRSKK